MRRLALVFTALSSAALAGDAPRRILNTFELSPKEGTAEIEWVSPSTFRFVRTWSGRQGVRKPVKLTPVPVSVVAQDSGYAFETRYLLVRAADDGEQVEIATASGAPVTKFRVRREDARVLLEHIAGRFERFYGLGARNGGSLDARGLVVPTREPFLLSTAGYGEFYPAPGEYTFDLAASQPDTAQVVLPGDRVEVFFYYGPTPKGIFEEHLGVSESANPFDALDLQIRDTKSKAGADAGTWGTLSGAVRSLLNSSMSAKLVPGFDLAPYARADDALFARAAEVASIMPVLYAPARSQLTAGKQQAYSAMESRRKGLEAYLLSYTREVRDRGIPVIRPLAMDYGQNTAPGCGDEFLAGDELLVAPVLRSAAEVEVCFPKGVWTDLNTERTYKGRQQLAVRAAPGVLPMFAKNGTIVPLVSGGGDGPLELHYFPNLGAEFFLAEESDPEVSQFHAAPAGDLVRLEIESKVARVYEWVLHHNSGCRRVESGGKDYEKVADRTQLVPGSWHFDAVRKSLRIRVRATAGGDEIVHVIL